MEPTPRATDPHPHAPPKLRLLCSYNGHILPRPHDKTLCYIGGDTRLITLDINHHHPPSLSKLVKKILKTTSFDANSSSFLIKYQLPSEDLDSLISVSTDEDLEHMIDEYNGISNNSSNSRIRLFLFPRNSDSVRGGEFVESVKSIGSVLLEGSDKSNEVFVQGLNGRLLLTSCLSFCSDNSLLELEDVEVKEVEKKVVVVQDVQEVNKQESPGFGSVPDSPVKVNGQVKEEVNYVAVREVKDPVGVVKVSGNGLGQRVSSGFDMASPDSVVTAKVSGNGLGQRVSSGFDMASPDSVSSDGSLTNPLSRRNPSVIYHDAATQTQYFNNNNGVTNDQNTRIQMQQQQIHDSVYSISTSTAAATPTTQTDLHKPNGVTNDQNTRIQMQQQQIHDSAYSMSTSTAAVTTTTQTDLHKPNGVANDQNTRIQMQQQKVHDSAYSMSTSTAAVTTTQTDLQHPQVHQQHQFIHTAVPPQQYIHHHPSGVVPMASYYPIYPPQSQHHVPVSALDQRKIVYYMPAISAPPNSQVPTPSSLFTTPRTVQPASKPESPVYRTNSSGASGPQLVQVPSSQHQHQHQPQPQYVAYSHIQQPSQAVASSGGSGGNYAYEFADLSQQGQHLYYAAQPLPPQSSAQYQTMSSALPVEGGSHIQLENSMKQQVKTSQP